MLLLDINRTILDFNKFVSDLTIKKHFSSIPFEEVLEDEMYENIKNNYQDPDLYSCSTTRNPSFHLQALVAVTQLHSLQAESREHKPTAPSSTFKTKNTEFYPLHSRTSSLEDRISLQGTIHGNSQKKNHLNLTRKAIQEVKNMPDIVI